MAKIGSLSTITTGYGSAEQLNNNFSEIRNAILNTLSLDGSTPNGMNADLDLNGQSLINAYSIQADTITIGGNALALSTLQTLESISDDIVTVASNVGNIGVVAGDITNINTIVTNLTDVQNVGSNITAITTLNTNITNINTVATNIVNVNLTAENIADVNAVGQGINSIYVVDNNITDIQTLADIEDGTVATNALSNLGPISTDITTVAGSISNVTTVSGSITNVNTVAGSIANVNATGGSITSVNTVAGNILNVNTVAGVDTEITTVAGISTDVSTVSGVSANVTTVANNIASVNTVATNIASVIAVANDLTEAISEVETVANDLNEVVSEIDTVATNIADVNTVGLNISDVTTVSSNIANVNTVAGVSTNVTTVAGISANVTTVAGIASDVTTVASDSAVINTVATAITDVSTVSADIASVITAANDLNEAVSEIETVAASITNVDAVGLDIANVNTVAASISNVNTTAGSITNVNTVSGSIANVNTVATNILDVTTVAGISSDVTTVAADGTDIGTVATNIANVNTVAGDISNVNTVATNITSVNDFFNVYRIGATDPTTSLDTGDLFYNTTSGTLKVYTGTAWEQGVTAGSGFLPLAGGTMTGAITFDAAQTFDGRDVSADGAKLDGIEAGATADQTKADIDALGINAATLDGLNSTQFLRSDTNDTATGSITFSNASGITIGEANIFHQTASTWRGITVKNNGDANEVAIDGQSSDGTQRLSIYGETSSQGFLNPTNNSWKLRLPTSGSFTRDNTYTIWDSGNDGAGSGLDADTVDGIQASSFLRTDADDSASGDITFTESIQIQSGGGSGNPIRIGSGFGSGGSATIHRLNGDLYLQYANGQASTNLFLGGGGTSVALNINDSNTKILEGTGNSVRVQTNYGYVDVGPQNTSWSHFQTDRPSFYFNKYLRAEGSIGVYGGTAYMDATYIYGDGSNLTNLPAATGISYNGNVVIESTSVGGQVQINAPGNIILDSASNDLLLRFGSHSMNYDASASEVRLSCRMEATEFEATSDINLKENIELLTDPLGKLSAISGYSYNFKDTGNASYGVIAQEVEKVLPDAVSTNAVGTKSVNYNSIVALLVETIKEQEKRIAALEAKVGV